MLSADWQARLSAPTARKVMLLTVNVDGAEPGIVGHADIGMRSGGQNVHTSGLSATVTTTSNAFAEVHVGDSIMATGIVRIVQAKASSTSLTVNSAVNWDNGGTGYAFTFGRPTTTVRHVALEPGSFCYGTEAVDISDSARTRTKPFLPFLQQWPEIRYSFAPQERRVEIPAVNLTILGDAPEFAALVRQRTALRMTGRLSLWSEGLPLEADVPLVAGHIVDSRVDRRTGSVQLTLADGDPERSTQFGEFITRAEFPDAPDFVVDVEAVREYRGEWPFGGTCPQIDRDARRFLLATPPFVSPPLRVLKDGTILTGGWQIVERHMATSGRAYQEIVLDEPAWERAEGLSGVISFEGGVALFATNLIEEMAAHAGLRLSSRARAIVRKMDVDFPTALALTYPANALEILQNRVLPQTPYAFSFRNNEIDLIPLRDYGREIRLGVGTGLLFRWPQQQGITSIDSVFNAIEVRCGRDMLATQAAATPLVRIVRDENNGPPNVRTLLAKSASRYGRRFLAFDANDLAVEVDANYLPVRSRSGEILADTLALLHAIPHQRHTYLADWLTGMSLDLNDRILLTDADEGLSALPVRVVEISYTATGPVVTFQTEDVTA